MNKDGFLLVELLVALSLFISFVFVITKFQSISLGNFDFASRKLEALSLALTFEQEKGHAKNDKIFKINRTKINYVSQINNIFLCLKGLLGQNLIFNTKEFVVQETIVSFNSLKGKKSEVAIKSSIFVG